MSDGKETRIYAGKDIVVVALSLLLAVFLVGFWMPAKESDDSAMIAFRMFTGFIGLSAVFMGICIYGILRFVPKGRRAVVLGVVALPALYGGLVVGGLRGEGPGAYDVAMQDSVRIQDGLAALWWGRQAATDLPSWTRGGMEMWPTAAGEILVQTTQDQVNVVLMKEATSRECQRLVGDVSEQREALRSVKGWVSINGREVEAKGDLSQVCRHGGMITLSAELPDV